MTERADRTSPQALTGRQHFRPGDRRGGSGFGDDCTGAVRGDLDLRGPIISDLGGSCAEVSEV